MTMAAMAVRWFPAAMPSMSFANSGSSGISTVQQNAGTASLQQNSVALGSYVGGGSTGFNGF